MASAAKRPKRLAQKSNQLPWFVYRPPNGDDAYIAYGTQDDDSDTYDLIDSYDVDADYEYIAAAHPKVVLRLIAELAKAKQEARAEALEEAAQVCDKHQAEKEAHYREWGDSSPHSDSEAFGAEICADLIRALFTPVAEQHV